MDSTESGMSNQPLLLLPDSTIITTNSIGKFVQNLFAGDYEIPALTFSGMECNNGFTIVSHSC
ncbi:MAG: hypothetical protein IPN61_18710 [Bacteroidetes bacterium]|nr:hypothetical protein [Bacteroidota bacterium]